MISDDDAENNGELNLLASYPDLIMIGLLATGIHYRARGDVC